MITSTEQRLIVEASIRRNMLAIADEMDRIAESGIELPEVPGVVTAFTMGQQARKECAERAGQIRALYGNFTFGRQQRVN
jgi:hypothetical protein